MFQSLIAFFTSIMAFFMSIFGIGGTKAAVYRDLAYGTHAAQSLDLYYPKGTPETADVYVFIHGGGWRMGDKNNYAKECTAAAQKGYIAASINYRMLPDGARYTDMLDDIGQALVKIKEQAAQDGIRVDRAAIMGISAGGHLSLLYAYTRSESAAIPLAFVVGQAAPVDFIDPLLFNRTSAEFLPYVSDLVGVTVSADTLEENRAVLEAASPYYQALEDSVPTILCYGQNDSFVPLSNGVSLDARLTQLGVEHAFFVYPRSNHLLQLDADVSAAFEVKRSEFEALYF